MLQPLREDQQSRVIASRTFVEALARRMAASMPSGVDVGDLVQDGMIGLIDAVHRYDEGRGIRFETFAERRVRGAMIDALRRDAWPRGVRRVRRELEAAREALRATTGGEPSLADLASASGHRRGAPRPHHRPHQHHRSDVCRRRRRQRGRQPAARLRAVGAAVARRALRHRASAASGCVRAMARLQPRDRRLLSLYYFQDATMKQIGQALGVNESRISQLHARALTRLKDALLRLRLRRRLVAHGSRRSSICSRPARCAPSSHDAVLDAATPKGKLLAYPTTSRTTRRSSASRKGLASQGQPLSSRNLAASVPVTSPVTKITRRA